MSRPPTRSSSSPPAESPLFPTYHHQQNHQHQHQQHQHQQQAKTKRATKTTNKKAASARTPPPPGARQRRWHNNNHQQQQHHSRDINDEVQHLSLQLDAYHLFHEQTVQELETRYGTMLHNAQARYVNADADVQRMRVAVLDKQQEVDRLEAELYNARSALTVAQAQGADVDRVHEERRFEMRTRYEKQLEELRRTVDTMTSTHDATVQALRNQHETEKKSAVQEARQEGVRRLEAERQAFAERQKVVADKHQRELDEAVRRRDQQVGRLRGELEDVRKRCAEAVEDADALKKDLETARRIQGEDVARHAHRARELEVQRENERKGWAKERDEWEQRLAALQERLADSESSLQDARKRAALLDARRLSQRSSMEGMAQKHQQTVAALKQRHDETVNELRIELETCRKRVAQEKEGAAGMRERHSSLAEKKEALDREHAHVVREMHLARTELHATKDQLTVQRSVVLDHETTIATQKEQLRLLKEELGEQRQLVAALESSLQDMDDRNTSSQSRAGTLESTVKTEREHFEKELVRVKEDRDCIRRAKCLLEREMRAMREGFVQATQRVTDLEKAKATLAQQWKQANAAFRELEGKHAEVRDQHQQQSIALKCSQDSLQAKTAALEKATQQLHVSTEECTRVTSKWKALEAKHATLVADHEQVLAKHAALATDAAAMKTELDSVRLMVSGSVEKAESAERTRASLEQDLGRLRARHEELENEMRTARSEARAATQGWERKEKQWDDRKSDMEGALRKLARQLELATEDVASLEATRRSLQARLEEVTRQRHAGEAALHEQTKAWKQEVEGRVHAEQQLQETRAALDQARSQLEDTKARLTKTKVHSMQTVQQLRLDLAQKERVWREEKPMGVSSSGSGSGGGEKIEEEDSSVMVGTSSAYSSRQNNVNQELLSELETARATIAQLEKTRASLSEECREVRGKLQDAVVRLETSDDERRELDRQRESLEKTVRTLTRQVDAIRAEVGARERELVAARKRVKDLEDSLCALETTQAVQAKKRFQDAIHSHLREARVRLEEVVAERSALVQANVEAMDRFHAHRRTSEKNMMELKKELARLRSYFAAEDDDDDNNNNNDAAGCGGGGGGREVLMLLQKSLSR